MPAQIVIDGLPEFLRKLNTYDYVAAQELQIAADASIALLEAQLRYYPAQRAGSRYRRTYFLQGQWGVNRIPFQYTSTSFKISTANRASYAGWVQGGAADNPSQAWSTKRAGWQTTDSVIALITPQVYELFKQALENIATVLNGGGI